MEDKRIDEWMTCNTEDNIAPFLWLRGEGKAVICEELDKILESNIYSICLESRPHPDFLGERWWEDMDFIISEAEKRNMKVWLLDDAHFPTGYANGLVKTKYPERRKRYLHYNMVDVWGCEDEVTIDLQEAKKPMRGWSQKVSAQVMEKEKENTILSVTAYPLIRDNLLDEDGGIDLTPAWGTDKITHRFPRGCFRVFVVYETEANEANGGNPDYINVIDEESVKTLIEAVYEPHYQHYGSRFGNTFLGFFSDEPGFGNTSGFSKDERIGHKDMALPWCRELRTILESEDGDSWLKKLPFLWQPTVQMEIAVSFRRFYMDNITKLYEKNFSLQIGNWCAQRNVRYIGHVIEDAGQHTRLGCGPGHYFRAMSGQHMAGIDTIGTQLIMGGGHFQRSNSSRTEGRFFHYVLAKLGASSAALDPNKQGMTMCELFGAYGWELRIRDMKWLVDHMLVNGVNYFVPHAFSMADYPDRDCPPHFYARGNNPQFPCFGELMKYTAKMGRLLSGGIPVIDAAVFYHGESEWMGDFMPVDEVACELAGHQVSYLIVCLDHLMKAEADGQGIMINKIRFSKIVIPYCRYIPAEVAERMEELGVSHFVFVNEYPEKAVSKNSVVDFNKAYESKVYPLGTIGRQIKLDMECDVRLEKESAELRFYHYLKNGKNIYFFHNESPVEEYRGQVYLSEQADYVYYDQVKKRFCPVKGEISSGYAFYAEIPVYGTLLLIEDTEQKTEEEEMVSQELIDISRGWNVSICRSCEYPEFKQVGEMEELVPYSRIDPHFSGVICYEKEIQICGAKPVGSLFSAASIGDGAQIYVNGHLAETLISPPYQAGLGTLLESGNNMIRVEVRTTLEREEKQRNPSCFSKMLLPQNPAGMFGKVSITVERSI